MHRTILLILIMGLLHSSRSFAAETCSRVAIINFQEVLVDTSTSRKGEGLRYHLAKDKMALSYLDKYQDKSRPMWLTAALSTAGASLVIAGIFQHGDQGSSQFSDKKAFFIGGAAMITLSYLISKTIEYNNTGLLVSAIEEYNKRNLPRIYFSPYKAKLKSNTQSESIGVSAGIIKEF